MSKLKELCKNKSLVVDLSGCTISERREALLLAESVGFKWASGVGLVECQHLVERFLKYDLSICIESNSVTHGEISYYKNKSDYYNNIINLENFKSLVEDCLYE